MENEIWKDVEGFEGRYQVSNLGRVKSIKRIKPVKENLKGIKEIIMIPYSGAARYLGVTLRKDGKGKTHTIHRLVAEAFLPNPLGFPCVNHKDGDCLNNRVDNLEWCNQRYNIKYANISKEQRSQMSELLEKKSQHLIQSQAYNQSANIGRGRRKRSVCVYSLDMTLIKCFPSIKDAASSMSFTNQERAEQAIRSCCKGNRTSAFGYVWRYFTIKELAI